MNMLGKIKALAYKYETENGWKSNHAACFTLKETKDIIKLIEAVIKDRDICTLCECGLCEALKPFTEEKEQR